MTTEGGRSEPQEQKPTIEDLVRMADEGLDVYTIANRWGLTASGVEQAIADYRKKQSE